MAAACAAGLLIAALALCATGAAADASVTRTVTRSDVTDTVREKEAIKSKLEGTEARVRELLADLETFSTHATNAKAEIHSSLLDTWKNVELLARDRCGSELESIRISQRKAEAKVAELQDELRSRGQEAEALKLTVSKTSNSESAFKSELSAERSRREAVEAEVHELRDKLHWASATANETRSYDLVADRLEALLLVVTERSQMLQRVMMMVTDHHAGYEDWRVELTTLGDMVRDANRGFSGDLKSAASDALQRRVSDLERRLRDAQQARDDAVRERAAVTTSFDKLRSTSKMSPATASFAGDRVVYHTRDGVGIVGVLTACVMTLLCGGVLLLFCGWGGIGGGGGGGGGSGGGGIGEGGGGGGGGGGAGSPYDTAASGRKSNGYTPDRLDKPTGGLHHAQTSPMTYGSGQRQSTPRRY
jgi:hypothetical protein